MMTKVTGETTLPLRVSTQYSKSELEKAFGVPCSDKEDFSTSGICLDSRILQKGDLFFALSGDRDGHEFLQQAFDRGAFAAVVSKEGDTRGKYFNVKNVKQALNDLALARRKAWGGKIVAISGSNGKTTTKEMTFGLLRAFKPTLKSPGTWNNDLGVPLTLLMLEKRHEYAVLEMGMNHLGEIAGHCAIALPDIAVLTNIGHAHIGELGSIENIARAKAELFEGVGNHGTLVVLVDDPRIAEKAKLFSCKKIFVSQEQETEVCIRSVKKIDERTNAIRVMYGTEAIELEVGYFAKHQLSNLLCALGSAYAMGVPVSVLQAGVECIELPPMRLSWESLSDRISLVDDTYNANPDSMRVALESIRSASGGRNLAVLGDMLELGSHSASLHQEIGGLVAKLKFRKLFCIGKFANDYAKGAFDNGMSQDQVFVANDKKNLIETLFSTIEPEDCLLVKGSRGSKMEEVSIAVRARYVSSKKENKS